MIDLQKSQLLIELQMNRLGVVRDELFIALFQTPSRYDSYTIGFVFNNLHNCPSSKSIGQVDSQLLRR